MKKILALSSIIAIAVIGVAARTISTEHRVKAEPVTRLEVKAAKVADISAKEHTGWD